MSLAHFCGFKLHKQPFITATDFLVWADILEEQGDWRAEVIRIVIAYWNSRMHYPADFMVRMNELARLHPEAKMDQLSWFKSYLKRS